MKKLIPLIILTFSFVHHTIAQQDAMFTKYMFNSLNINPAYAGSKEYFSIVALYRNQWWGIEGAPQTQIFSLHSPVNERIGLGLNLAHDKIGVTGRTSGNLSYAYRLPLSKGKLSIGVQASLNSYRANYGLLNLEDPMNQDQSFSESNVNQWFSNFGTGLFWYSKKSYIGVSVPQLIERDLRKNEITTSSSAKLFRHLYFTAGTAIPIKGDFLVFKPSVLIKNVGLLSNHTTIYSVGVGAPTEFDIDLSLLFYESLWVGTSFRSSVEAFTNKSSSFDSIDFWALFNLKNGIRIGMAYDFTISQLGDYAKGSLEIMLGYDFNYNNKEIVTPRYF